MLIYLPIISNLAMIDSAIFNLASNDSATNYLAINNLAISNLTTSLHVRTVELEKNDLEFVFKSL